MRIVVLVDGSNVARCAAWQRAARRDRLAAPATDPELRRRLVDAICSWAAHEGHEVQVAFDGAGPWRPGAVRVSDEVEVIGSGRAEGDDLLERLASDSRDARRTHWLVTSDTELRHVAGAGADRIIDSDVFAAELLDAAWERAGSSSDAGFGAGAGQPPGSASSTGSRLAEALDDDVRARLERMRRGTT